MAREQIPVSELVFRDDLRSRETPTDSEAVADYTEKYLDGIDMPDLVGFRIKGIKGICVTEGWNRGAAALAAKIEHVWVNVHEGTLEDAKLSAAASNLDNGLLRTVKAKERAIQLALEVRPDWSDRMVASHVRVSVNLVKRVRNDLTKLGTIRDVDAGDRVDRRGGRVGSRGGSGKKDKPAREEQDDSVEVESQVDSPEPIKPTPPPDILSQVTIPEAVLVDDAGRDIPRNLADTFNDKSIPNLVDLVDNATEVVAALTDAIERFASVASFYPWLDRVKCLDQSQKAAELLQKIGNELYNATPSQVCRECDGSGCKSCRNSGYYPKGQIKKK